MKKIKIIFINDFVTQSGYLFDRISLTYEVFGNPDLKPEKTVLVNHALTGNSTVIGKNGWWNSLIGNGKRIDTGNWAVLAFNFPGNGYGGDEALLHDFENLTLADIARLFIQGCQKIGLKQIYAVIGGSIGGMLIWEMAKINPQFAEVFIPVACDYKSSDWVLGQNHIQRQMVRHMPEGLKAARMMAMLFYRTPDGYKERFHRSIHAEKKIPNVESYLTYQGDKLSQRFHPEAYLAMMHYMDHCSTADDPEMLAEIFSGSEAKFRVIGIDSDILFPPEEIRNAVKHLNGAGVSASYGEIHSIYGHDAFLVEFDQLDRLLKDEFKKEKRREKIGERV